MRHSGVLNSSLADGHNAKFNDEIAHLECRAVALPRRGLALARAFVAHVGALSAAIPRGLLAHPRSGRGLPLSMALLVLAASPPWSMQSRRLAALAIYRHPVDLPERSGRRTVARGRSDPLDQSRLGEWLSRPRTSGARAPSGSAGPEAAMHCAANLDL
ncbi:MAG: hypothetical protein U1E50_19500 [Caulobacteraceae bacterium]